MTAASPSPSGDRRSAATAALGPLLGGWLTTALLLALGLRHQHAAQRRRDHRVVPARGRVPRARPPEESTGAARSSRQCGLGALVFGLIEGRTYGWFTTTDHGADRGWSSGRGRSHRSPSRSWSPRSASPSSSLVQRAPERRRPGGHARPGSVHHRVIPQRQHGGRASSAWASSVLFRASPLVPERARLLRLQTGIVLLPWPPAASGQRARGRDRAATGLRSSLVRLGIVLEIAGLAGIGCWSAPGLQLVCHRPAAVRLRHRRRLRHRSAHRGGAGRRAGGAQRSGFGDPEHRPSVGSAFGIAVLGTVLFSVLGARFDASLTDAGVPEQTRTQLVAAVKDSAGAAIPSLAADPRTAAIAETPSRR